MNPFQRYLPHILFILLALSIVFGFYNYAKLAELKKNPQQAAQEESKELVSKVGKIFDLPKEETPTIATVNNPEALKDQPFFINAKAGYKVLIYTEAKIAIMYDPVNHKVIGVAPVNIGPNQKTAK